MTTDMTVSDHCLFRKAGDSKDTLLVFSEVNTSPGRFTGYKVFAETGRNVVFLNCRSDWFIHGVPGLGDDLDSTIFALRGLLGEHVGPGGRIVAYGGSMGGYGALLYGALLEVDRVVACGAETILNIPFGHSRPHLHGEQFFLRPILEKASCHFDLYYGEFSFYDMVCALHVMDLDNVSITTVANRHHAIPGYLHAEYGLTSLTEAAFGGSRFQLGPGDTGSYLGHPEIIRLVMALRVAADRGKKKPFDGVANMLRVLLARADNPLVRSYGNHHLSVGYGEQGDWRRALAHARRAHGDNPENISILSQLALCLVHALDPGQALPFAEQALAMHRPDYLEFASQALAVKYMARMEQGHAGSAQRIIDSIETMRWNMRPATVAKDAFKGYAKFLLEQGRHQDAARELGRAIRRKPGNASLHLMLSRALEGMDCLDAALREAETAFELGDEAGRFADNLKRLRGKKQA